MVQVNPRNGILNYVDHEDLSNREDKQNKLIGLMENGVEFKLDKIMEKEGEIKKLLFRKRVKDIERYQKTGKLLDVGCAQGAFLFACTNSNLQLYGVEPSKYTSIMASKIAHEVTIYNSTLLEARLPQNNFDVVTLINTLEHLVNPKETLEEVCRILKSGGLLMIETPNVAHWLPSLMGRHWVQFLVPDHVVFFSKDVLTDMLCKIGFDVREIKSGNKMMSVRLLLFHLSHYLGSMSKGIMEIIMKICERTGFAGKTITIPQWDEMILLARKIK
ncbi:MAG: class I SAM-dependent methyltransferase [Ignavibacteriae bacterium]|nr:class I SAM-dependent methyltransferase [Ignavibacteriota bacterium]